MKILKFRIKNYKSIEDSGDCFLSDKITILAGKNESGKTAILEALADFHEDKKIREEAWVIGSKKPPEIIITFKLTADDVSDIYKSAGLQRLVKNDIELDLGKIGGKDGYFLSEKARLTLGWGFSYDEVIEKIESLSSLPQIIEYNGQELSTYKNELQSFLPNINEKEEGYKKVSAVIEEIEKYTEIESNVNKFIETFVEKKLPYFILFSSFEDSFPDEIPVVELESNEWASDLEEVSSFSKKAISSENKQEQQNHQRMVNTEFTSQFKEFWTQDQITLNVNKDGGVIYFWIEENECMYKPSQRSKGQQWYLSFFVRIVARISEDKPNVILIDEPGLFLHAKAQKDMLKVLNNNTSDYPIIFSTHSPYLITEDNIENVRLVEKAKSKTSILGKIHAHRVADKETLTPILTAIGLGVNDSITNVNQKNNVVVEGPEDVFYLQAFNELVNKNKPRVNFINGGGAGKMGIVGAILEGWGANVYYLLDKDKGGSDGEKNLESHWGVLSDAVKFVTKKQKGTTVDLLSNEDFKKYVLENENLKSVLQNSEYITKNNLDKVLLARCFLQKVKSGSVKLNEDSLKNIRGLFQEIKFDKKSTNEEE